MADSLREYTLWFTAMTGALYAIIKLLQSIIKLLSARSGGEVANFESVTGQLNRMLTDCRATCSRLEELREQREEFWKRQLSEREESILALRDEHQTDREHFYEEIARLTHRVRECEGIMDRNGWKEVRQRTRNKPTGGNRVE